MQLRHMHQSWLALSVVAVIGRVAVAEDITNATVQQANENSNGNLGTACCTLLKYSLGDLVSSPPSLTYTTSEQSYWSAQAQQADPRCIVSPTTTTNVSKTVEDLNLIRLYGLQCPYAIRSGGHTPWLGAASINDGITIDLAAIKQVTVAADQKTTSVGPGARWLDVYTKLDALQLAVPGGRVASVGVGGLVTGGGVSFFSPRYGFVADNVVNFEVVLYDGTIVNANAQTNPDLHFALKGGSNNFGVVTRIDLNTFSQGKFWGGAIYYPIQTLSKQLSAFVNFTSQPNYDIYGALINSYAWTAAAGGWLVANNIEYTKAVVNPPVFQEFTSIQPQTISTMRISTLSDFAIELDAVSPAGRRQLFYTSTYANDLPLLTEIFNQCNESLQSVIGVVGLSWSLSLQPVVTAITKFGALDGGNPLGLDPTDGNVVLALLTASWTLPTDDVAVISAGTLFFKNADNLAASKKQLNPYKYLNYAYKTQKPIQGYGAANVAKLQAVSKKYDPFGVFQRLVPGGFKLW